MQLLEIVQLLHDFDYISEYSVYDVLLVEEVVAFQQDATHMRYSYGLEIRVRIHRTTTTTTTTGKCSFKDYININFMSDL